MRLAGILIAALLAGCRESELHKKYPWTVLNNDHGILDGADVVLYRTFADTVPFDENETEQATYRWQCFPVSTISAACDDKDLLWDPDIHGYAAGDSVLVHLAAADHVYYHRRAYDVRFCREWARSVRRLMDGERYACIGGEFAEKESDPMTGRPTYSWTYDKFKTKKGCSSWAVGDCDSAAALVRQNAERAELARRDKLLDEPARRAPHL